MLMTWWSEAGFEPKLVPRNGGDTIEFYPLLEEVCSQRAKGLLKIGSDVSIFINSVIRTTGIWSHHKASDLEKENTSRRKEKHNKSLNTGASKAGAG